jgi:hypothetical protein
MGTTKATTYVGWLRRDRGDAWRPVARGTYAQVEQALAELPGEGRPEESIVLPAGQQPIGRCEHRP